MAAESGLIFSVKLTTSPGAAAFTKTPNKTGGRRINQENVDHTP